MENNPLLPFFSKFTLIEVLAIDRIPSMSQIKLFDHLNVWKQVTYIELLVLRKDT